MAQFYVKQKPATTDGTVEFEDLVAKDVEENGFTRFARGMVEQACRDALCLNVFSASEQRAGARERAASDALDWLSGARDPELEDCLRAEVCCQALGLDHRAVWGVMRERAFEAAQARSGS